MQQTLEGYFRSHPLPAERIAQVQKLIASEGWAPKTERDLRVAFVFKTVKARQALDLKNYKRAEELANQSLRMRPDRPRHWMYWLWRNFTGELFRLGEYSSKLLEIEPANEDAIASFARALAAADGKSAVSEFQKWEAGISGPKSTAVEAAAAGSHCSAAIQKAPNSWKMCCSKTEALKLPKDLENWDGGTISPESIPAPSNFCHSPSKESPMRGGRACVWPGRILKCAGTATPWGCWRV